MQVETQNAADEVIVELDVNDDYHIMIIVDILKVVFGLDDEVDEPDEIDAMLKVCTELDETDDLEYVDIDDEVEVGLELELQDDAE